MKKGLSFFWELMFTRSSFNTADMGRQSEILNSISKLVDEQKIISPVKTVLSPINAANIKYAPQLLESRRTIGKVILSGF